MARLATYWIVVLLVFAVALPVLADDPKVDKTKPNVKAPVSKAAKTKQSKANEPEKKKADTQKKSAADDSESTANDSESTKKKKLSKQDNEVAEAWAKLTKRKEETFQKLEDLKVEYDKTDPDDNDERTAIRIRYLETVGEFQQQLYPAMTKLAEKAFELNPEDYDAGEMVLGDTYGKNQFQEAAQIAERIIKTGQKTKIVLNVAGIAYFAMHQFDESKRILEEAKKLGKLDKKLKGMFYLDYSTKYLDYWKREQAIRIREVAAKGNEALPRVVFETSRGQITLELFENEAPNTVANFINLVETKYYNETRFHRVVSGFMVQGGDPLSKDLNPSNDGTGGPGYVIDCECYRPDARFHFRGSLSMAHAGKDTGGSQFFITHLPTPHLNPVSGNKSKHTVFGRVIEGMDVVDQLQKNDPIKKAFVLRKRNHVYRPVTKRDKRRRF